MRKITLTESFYFIKVSFFFYCQMEINCPIAATIAFHNPAMNHSYLTTLTETPPIRCLASFDANRRRARPPLRLSPMLRPFVLNDLTKSLIDWNPTYFSIVLIKFVSLLSTLS